MTILDFAFAFLAALGAGFVNSIAGGGTLITFPVLVALGIPPVVANVTNSVALAPGMLGGIYAQRRDFDEQKMRLFKILPVSILGGLAGGLILLNTHENSFRTLIPYLILIATVLLAFQGPIKNWVVSRNAKHASSNNSKIAMFLLIFFASIYGGYFGAGLGVILLAILGLVIDDSLTKLNVLKQAIALSVNLSAAIYFSFSGKVDWYLAIIMAVGAIIGGLIGGSFVGKIKPSVLKWIVVFIGSAVALVYFLK